MRHNVARAATMILICGWLPVSAGAQSPSDAPERDVASVVERIETALANRDRAALEPLLASGFTWVHASDGRVDTREVFLANAAQGSALAVTRAARTVHAVEYAFHGAPMPHTAMRLARVRLVDSVNARESWIRQVQILVLDSAGAWRLAYGQGTLVYDGAPQDTAMLPRYAGTYEIDTGRALVLTWTDGALMATLPNGAQSQIFLASPTEEAIRVPAAGQLRFTLGPDGAPTTASLVRNGREVWRARRRAP